MARSSPNVRQERIAALTTLFPDVVREGAVDVDVLRAALGEAVNAHPERYNFTWAGKRDAIQVLQMPSRATLGPSPKESIRYEETGNLFIEGDNLEVLKLLYKAYFSRVKMIYIDPPFNTGNDFVYRDDYADPLEAYLGLTGQADVEGNLLTSNPETSGRYHSAWLSMMYPRLFLARQLLRQDGVIFVSIDDHEVYNLRLVMNEIFGEENFLATFVRKRRMATGMRDEPVSPDHEYVLAYAKSAEHVELFGEPIDEASYPFEDEKGRYRSTDLTVGMTKEMRPNQFYAVRNPQGGKEYWPPAGRVWRFQPSTMAKQIKEKNIIWPDDDPDRSLTRPRFKTRFNPEEAALKTKAVSTWVDTKAGSGPAQEAMLLVAGMNMEGTKELRDLLGAQVVEYPKPVSLLRALVALGAGPTDIVMDFFAGSATTAHAVLDLNRENGDRRRFIMVQLPEPTAEDSTARQTGYTTIAEIGKERIRRVIAKLEKEKKGKLDFQDRPSEDLGFRVFKLNESNYRPWTGVQEKDPDAYAEQMAMFADPLIHGWNPENVIWEVAIKEGYGLTSSIERVSGSGRNTVWRVTDLGLEQSFLTSLADRLTPTAIEALALRKEDLFVCRDAAIDDELAANLALQCQLKTI